jgi:hypothetical protein
VGFVPRLLLDCSFVLLEFTSWRFFVLYFFLPRVVRHVDEGRCQEVLVLSGYLAFVLPLRSHHPTKRGVDNVGQYFFSEKK